MNYKPGDIVYGEFVTSRFDTGAATNADSLPTATLNRNGTDDATSVTVTNLDTGRYKFSFTIPATWNVGDVLNVSIAATVNSVAGKGIVWATKLGVGTLTTGTATAGGALTITLQTAIGADNLPNGTFIIIVAGTGAGQLRRIASYANSTKVATVDAAWTTNPDATSVYAILWAGAMISTTQAGNLDAAVSTRSTYAGADTSGTTTLLARLTSTRAGLLDNLDVAVSTRGDATAANQVTINANVLTRLAASAYTTPPTVAAIASGVWQDTTAGDFTVAGSIGKSLGGSFSALGTSVFTAASLINAPGGTGGGGDCPTTTEIVAAITAASLPITVAAAYDPDTAVLTLVRGRDYKSSEGRALEWSSTGWTDLTGASVALLIYRAGGAAVSISGTVVTAGGSGTTQLVRFQPTRTQLAIAPRSIQSPYLFEVVATMGNGDKIPLVGPGDCVVEQNAEA